MKSYVRMKPREIWSVKDGDWREGKSFEELKRSIESLSSGRSEEKTYIEQDIVSIVARYEDVGFEECSVEEYRLDNDYRVDNVASLKKIEDKVFVTLFSLFR